MSHLRVLDLIDYIDFEFNRWIQSLEIFNELIYYSLTSYQFKESRLNLIGKMGANMAQMLIMKR
jgi:hypothetical protein